jgi:hypothetical protein
MHQRTLRFLACLLCLIGMPAFGEPQQVELDLQCRASANAVELRITLRNAGPTDTAIVLGTSIGNGQKYVADSLVLDVKRGRDGPVEKFRPDVGNIAGRVDPWIVPLPAASDFSFTRSINTFFSSTGKPPVLGNGSLDIRLTLLRRTEDHFRGELVGPGLVKVFVGELATDWLRVPGQCHVG